MSHYARGRSMADDTGVTRRDAAIRQWIGFNTNNLDPRGGMDADDFEMARDEMLRRLNRMFVAMFTVYPHLTDRFARLKINTKVLQRDFIENYFVITKNRVWALINDTHGLSQMRMRLEEYLDLLLL